MCVCMEQNFIYRDKIWCSGWKKDSERKTVKERQLKRDLRFLRQLNRYLVWFRLISLNKDNFKYILLWNKKTPNPQKNSFFFFRIKREKKEFSFCFFLFLSLIILWLEEKVLNDFWWWETLWVLLLIYSRLKKVLESLSSQLCYICYIF